MSRRAAAALAVACALSACAPRGRLVVSDGWAPEDPEHPGSAARRATADALRRAVEKTAGVSLIARTRVDDGASASERMLADASGCILRYEVLSLRPENGGRAARVRAEVSADAAPCAGRPPLPRAVLDDLAVSVALSATGEHGDFAAHAAESALRAGLADRGWRVVDGAPLRLTGVAVVRRTEDARLGPLTSERAELSLRVERAADGRVLRESTSSGAAVDVDPAAAARAAARAAAAAAVTALAPPIEAGSWRLGDAD